MIQPGLERIGLLLKNVDFPWKAIHVAGTNGKGSICAYAHSLLRHRDIPCGRFTSPHLVNRWDCIYINDKPVGEAQFKKIENHFKSINKRENIQASEFELLTATAFQLFNEWNVTFGVVEVGMGGTLDATNILNNQVVSVIAKIAHDHQNFLGNTIHEIARHKAGILRPDVPYLVSPANELPVKLDIDDVAKEVAAGPRIDMHAELQHELTSPEDWRDWEKFAFKIPPFQRFNALLAYFAVKEALGGRMRLLFSLRALREPNLPGRCESHAVPLVFGNNVQDLLVDGAHNEDAAAALDEYVSGYYRKQASMREGKMRSAPDGRWPITWVMAMSEGKDPVKVLKKLLKPGDNIILTTFGPVDGMPWVKPMAPEEIFNAAREVVPDITGLVMPKPPKKNGVHEALMAARFLADCNSRIVLTGSLYLVGDFLREKTHLNITRKERIRMRNQWRNRINRLLSLQPGQSAFAVDGSEQLDFDEEEDGSHIEDEEDMLHGPTKSSIKREMMRKAQSLDLNTKDDSTDDTAPSRPKRSSSKGKDPVEHYFGLQSPFPGPTKSPGHEEV